MALTAAEQSELSSLQAARTQLLSGQMPSRVVYQGRETEFAKIDANMLDQRIAFLSRKGVSRRCGSGPFAESYRFSVR